MRSGFLRELRGIEENDMSQERVSGDFVSKENGRGIDEYKL